MDAALESRIVVNSETLDRLKTHLADSTARLEKVREGYIDTEKQRQKRQRNRDKRNRETETKETEKQR